MKFIGSKELLILYRTKRNGTVELKIKKGFQCGKDFVVLVGLTDYFNFITDSEQKLKRYFFEENVRDYLWKQQNQYGYYEFFRIFRKD